MINVGRVNDLENDYFAISNEIIAIMIKNGYQKHGVKGEWETVIDGLG